MKQCEDNSLEIVKNEQELRDVFIRRVLKLSPVSYSSHTLRCVHLFVSSSRNANARAGPRRRNCSDKIIFDLSITFPRA